MEIAQILNEIQERGLRAVIRNGLLYVGPGERVSADLREALKDNMAALLAHYSDVGDEDVKWRVAAMLAQLLPLQWPCPVPSLFALPDGQPNKEDCASCAELLDVGEGDSYVCGACARAMDIALTLWMQRPSPQAVRAA
jgi:hypothetical protein